ncbi:C69 family dipeptidase [Methanobrevibacter sp.]|uniref:C69 family dipeptidase n=1 Tax=Methanobrevibacter sp. TaxID=66852 RepID=UPI00388D3AB2
MLKLNYLPKKLVFLLFCVLLLCSMQACFACTAVYVGSDVSDDGSVIVARSNDYPAVWGNHITVTPGVENESGRTMPVSVDGNVKTEIPETTYKYTATPYMDSAVALNEEGVYDAAACTNEYGVVMTMSVTAYPNKAALTADPRVDSGICEDAAVDLVICQSKTARGAVEVLLGIIDKYGSSESNIAIIADQSEAWYVEMYTGYQYAAVKLPSDKVAVFGNEYSLEYLSDFEEVITSKDLITLAEENGFAVYGKNNEINLFETYSGSQMARDVCHMRTWIGHQILAPSQFGADYNISALYPLCFTPDRNVSLQDVCQILRNRFEGTKYSPDEIANITTRPIGTENALSAHVLQVFPDLPAEMSCVSWVSCGPPIYGVFVPVSNACINVSEAYGANQPAEEKGVFDTDNYPYYVFKELCYRCVGPDHYDIYGKPVKEYWYNAESNMFAEMSEILAQAAKMTDINARAIYITSYCNDVQSKAFEDGKKLLEKVPLDVRLIAGDLTTNSTEFEYNAALMYNNMSGIANRTLLFDIGEETYSAVTNSSGVANITAILPNGKYPITVRFMGDDDFGRITKQATIFVNSTKAVDLKAPKIEMYYKNGTKFLVSLTSNGTAIANETVIININGVNNTRKTNENGTISMSINLDCGEYPIVVYYKGNDIYDPAKVNSKVTVLSTVNASDVTKIYRNATQYYATFLDGEGNPLTNGTAVFNINGVMYERKINENGTAKLNINLEQGTYIITAAHPTNGEMHSNTITVLPKITENKDLIKYYRNASQYIVKVLDDEGNPVGAGETVTFNINGVMYERKTNATGHAKLNINLEQGNYIITASYGGCNVANNITVLSVLSAEDLTKVYGTPDQFVATLVDGQGNALANANVTFNINGVMYERMTNATGQAKLNINLMVGEYIITSSYDGCNIANTIKVTA